MSVHRSPPPTYGVFSGYRGLAIDGGSAVELLTGLSKWRRKPAKNGTVSPLLLAPSQLADDVFLKDWSALLAGRKRITSTQILSMCQRPDALLSIWLGLATTADLERSRLWPPVRTPIIGDQSSTG